LEEIAPEIDPKILLLPVIDLDQVLQNRVSSLVPNLFTGGHHVPGHAHYIDKWLLLLYIYYASCETASKIRWLGGPRIRVPFAF
ncbi:MAG: hypothetical protein Q8O74_06255, partial [bacterium]|nr:hypothetical protein [bacterium]